MSAKRKGCGQGCENVSQGKGCGPREGIRAKGAGMSAKGKRCGQWGKGCEPKEKDVCKGNKMWARGNGMRARIYGM